MFKYLKNQQLIEKYIYKKIVKKTQKMIIKDEIKIVTSINV